MGQSTDTLKKPGRLKAVSGRAGRFIKRHKKLFIFLLVLAVLAAAALVVYNMFFRKNAAANVSIPETTMLAKMDLELVVTATGTLQSAEVYDVDSDLSYKVAEIYVAEGDAVTSGQPLAMLDGADLEETIADLQEEIAESASDDAKALAKMAKRLQDAYDDRDENYADSTDTINDAKDALDSAKSTRGKAKTEYERWAPLVAAAQEKYKAAQKVYDSALSDWKTAKKKNDLSDADGPSLVAGDPGFTEWTALTDAKAALDIAESEMNATETDTGYTGAKAAYDSAKNAVDTAQSSYDKAVKDRDSRYKTDTDAIETAQENYDEQAGKDSTKSLRDQLEDAIEERQDLTIYAPAAGTVTTISAEVGKSAGGNAAGNATGGTGSTAGSSLFTLQNLQSLEIPVSIAEYDAISLRVGMSATITTDAVDDAEWTGIVDSISPVASDGYFTVMVTVSSPPEQLTTGMSTTVDIITDAATGVYAVPFDAVTTNAAGQTVVYALDLTGGGMPNFSGEMPEGFDPDNMPEGFSGPGGGQMPNAGSDGSEAFSRTEIVVETGLETDYYIEISGEGLYDGLAIINDPLGNSVSSTIDMGAMGEGGFTMGGMGGMGGGMGGGEMPSGGPPSGGPPA